MLGKDDVRSTHAALADIAEACLKQIAAREYTKLVEKFGEPTILDTQRVGAADRQVHCSNGSASPTAKATSASRSSSRSASSAAASRTTTAISISSSCTKPGGNTLGRQRGSHGSTTNSHFFSELGQRVIRMMSHLGPHGRLYEVDARLRPTGKSGPLAVPLDAFARYFSEGRGQLWERQALCKARVVLGAPAAAEYAMQAVAEAAFGPPWDPQVRHRDPRDADAARRNRVRSATSSAAPAARSTSSSSCRCCSSSTAATTRRSACPARSTRSPHCKAGGYLSADDADYFRRSYRFQRSVEARIRLMNAAGRHELPDNPKELAKLAYLLGYADASELVAEAEHIFSENRVRFNRIFKAAERD